jgi:hypothetical protein
MLLGGTDGEPIVIELREWSRLAAEVQQERVRLGNRIRQQLWRYYPQLLALTDDVAAEWVLELWVMAPTPAKAARLLKRRRIRKINAETAFGILHLRSLVTWLRLANREFHQAERKLDEGSSATFPSTRALSSSPSAQPKAMEPSNPELDASGPRHAQPGARYCHPRRLDSKPSLRRRRRNVINKVITHAARQLH